MATLLVSFVLFALVGLGALVVRLVVAPAATGSGHTTTVVVRPGETVWDIAQRLDPTADVRTTVEQIASLNGLSGAGEVEAGQRLVVPVGSR